MRILFLLFLIMPILEVWVLLRVGGAIGGFNTVALVVLTAIVGVFLLRQQSFATVLRARQKMQSGEAPMGEMVEGLFLAVGGALLLTPGFITDALGLCCLLPGIRRGVIGWALRRMTVVNMSSYSRAGGSQADKSEQGKHTIEGEYRREDIDPRSNSNRDVDPPDDMPRS